jgi:hypothetical protein
MAANFTSYTVALRGTGSGIQPGIRATAALFNGTTVVGLVHCWDAGTTIPNDSSATPLTMNVPVTMLPVVLDVLRHEGPLQVDFNTALGKVLLYTATTEPVGEDET